MLMFGFWNPVPAKMKIWKTKLLVLLKAGKPKRLEDRPPPQVQNSPIRLIISQMTDWTYPDRPLTLRVWTWPSTLASASEVWPSSCWVSSSSSLSNWGNRIAPRLLLILIIIKAKGRYQIRESLHNAQVKRKEKTPTGLHWNFDYFPVIVNVVRLCWGKIVTCRLLSLLWINANKLSNRT